MCAEDDNLTCEIIQTLQHLLLSGEIQSECIKRVVQVYFWDQDLWGCCCHGDSTITLQRKIGLKAHSHYDVNEIVESVVNIYDYDIQTIAQHVLAHLSAMLLAVCRKRAWSVSFRAWSAWVMRDDDLSKNCLQLAICWASFLKRTTCKQTRASLFTNITHHISLTVFCKTYHQK